ncbi:MAG TPA: YciI family protein [Alphaproteobacteria bacterium]|nr:YciI family protein [Alphaproteobacteria bacterium]
MLYVVLFTDNPARAEARMRLMPAHLDFLERNSARVRAAGPLREGDGAPAGGLWLVEAADLAEVETLYQEDPFWPTGLRQSVRVLQWTQVFADGQRLIKVTADR